MKNTHADSLYWFYLYVFIVLSTIPTTIGAWNLSNVTRFKRDTCNELKEFQCVSNKKCINVDLRCDGKRDCPDGSDETTECKEFSCYGFLFTCDYGACIEMAKRCDGNRDCWDNSDEVNCVVDNSDKPEGNCSSNNFECNSGQCIDLDDKCNGKEDCNDRSDETKETCLNEWCPGFLFKCNYGACIDSFRECNGVSDCADGSDEVNCPGLTPKPPKPTPKPPPPPTPDSGCILPPTPKHGRWKAPIPLGGSGSIIPSSTLLSLVCDSGYGVAGLNGANFIACIDTDWQSVIPTCEKLCPAQYSEKIMTVKCYSNDGALKEIKCDQAVHNSFAKIECAKFYEFPNRPRLRNSITRFCYNGKWNLEFPECVPVCGERKVGQTLIVKGDKVERGNYPWVTAIFQVLEQEEIMNVCGGSMLTQNIIVTAAHCVTVDEDSGDLLDPSKVKVAVGKYFNKYKDPRDDSNAQYSDVKHIIKPNKYNGNIGSFQSDIALLVTKKKLNFSKYVQPVCYQDVTEINLRLGDEGVVTGWGFTKDSKDPSDELKELIVPYKDDDTCRKELPPDFFRFSTLDKFCAGFYNKSVGVCKGDSGGGLVYKDQNGRYQIVGLVSIGNIINNKCNVQASAFYTDVKQHYVWLEENISRNTIDVKEPR